MGLKNIDYKKFLLEKGERVGLWVAVGFMVLIMGYSLFVGDNGFRSGSQSVNAANLKEKADKGRKRIRDANPPDNLAPIPQNLLGTGTVQPHLVADAYRPAVDVFTPHPPDNSKRRAPKIYPPDESLVGVQLAQLRSYLFKRDQDGKVQVGIIKGLEAGASSMGGRRGNRGQGFGGPPGGAAGMGGGSGAYGRGGPPMGPGAPGAGGPMGGPGGGGFGGPLGSTGISDAKEGEIRFVELDKATDEELAEIIVPARVAIVCMSFPFKKQAEEFREALRKQSISELRDDEYPSFAGFNVERAEVQADGSLGPWSKLDLQRDFSPIFADGGRRRESEDKELEPLLGYSKGLMMPRPLQYRDGRYPKLETKLSEIQKTLDSIKAAVKANQPPNPRNNRFDRGGDIFNTGTDSDAATGAAPPGTGGAGKLGGNQPPDNGQPTGTEEFVPEHCPVRFLDVTVDPGKSYEYQIQIIVVNPNHKKTDLVAYPAIAKDEFLKSPFVPVGSRVTVPPEMVYYAVDEKEAQRDKDYKQVGNKARFNAAPDVSNDKEKTAMQIHKWLVSVIPNPTDRRLVLPVGDWSIAERVLVHRGDYIGRPEKVETPAWLVQRQSFVMAVNPKNKGFKKEIEVNFGFEKGPPDEAILVDFEGGRVTYDRAGEKATDDKKPSPTRIIEPNTPTEVLILLPDGRLVARDSKSDTMSTDRQDRRQDWFDKIEEVKNKNKPGKTTPAGGDLFNDNKPKGN